MIKAWAGRSVLAAVVELYSLTCSAWQQQARLLKLFSTGYLSFSLP
jgi:hypothetical protein